jgi:predicted small metal-binding protein
MRVTIACRDVGFDCDERIEAADADAALALAAAHVTGVHKLVDVTPDLVDRVLAVARTSPDAGDSPVPAIATAG